ncbi:MAG TPA: AAC(3) family N-acetyltransferase [Candidatus Limnocylindrales bacterium]|nr:AAC(3) family N-acetyltransferase [Candidatus Limnocylindrales bacterium]
MTAQYPVRQQPGLDIDRLAADISALGLRKGRDVLVHCAMAEIGWIDGDARSLLAAIRRAAGLRSTIVVPTHTTINSPTSRAFKTATEGMSPQQVSRFAKQLKGFDSADPTVETGRLAEYLLRRRDSKRSPHPLVSSAAVGPRAAELMAIHDLECHHGERSPMGALYAVDASILLLGVGYDKCSAIHLAEYRLARPPPVREYHCWIATRSRSKPKTFTGIDLNDGDFGNLGRDFDSAMGTRWGMVGGAVSCAVPIRDLVDFAVGWLTDHRPQS